MKKNETERKILFVFDIVITRVITIYLTEIDSKLSIFMTTRIAFNCSQKLIEAMILFLLLNPAVLFPIINSIIV